MSLARIMNDSLGRGGFGGPSPSGLSKQQRKRQRKQRRQQGTRSPSVGRNGAGSGRSDAAVHGFRVVQARPGRKGKAKDARKGKNKRRRADSAGGAWNAVANKLTHNVLGADDAILPRTIDFHRSTKPGTGYNTASGATARPGANGGHAGDRPDDGVVSNEDFVPPDKVMLSQKYVLNVSSWRGLHGPCGRAATVPA